MDTTGVMLLMKRQYGSHSSDLSCTGHTGLRESDEPLCGHGGVCASTESQFGTTGVRETAETCGNLSAQGDQITTVRVPRC